MSNYKVIDIALAEVGYKEKASNSNLDSKTANAGKANYTKYARDLDAITGFYNGKKNGYAWCDVFVDWCFVQAYGTETGRKMLYQPLKSLGAGCTYSANYYRTNKMFYSDPKVGDQIFFGDSGDEFHTGIVYKVTTSYVYTIEGNTYDGSGVIDNGGMVCKKQYARSNSVISGYGRPNYSLVGEPKASASPAPATSTSEKTTTTTTSEEGFDLSKLSMLSKGSKGEQVRSMQILLIGKGYSCGGYGADGDFGNDTLGAVKRFQKAKLLTQDGICGPLTWAALLGA